MSTPMWRRYLRFLGPDVAADVDDELQFHLETRVEELEAAGMTSAEARAQALRDFGDVERVRRECQTVGKVAVRRRRWREWGEEVRQDVHFALRQLRKSPSFALVVVATLALGIGANTTIFSLLNGVVLNPLPYRDPGRLLAVSPEHTFSKAEFAALRERVHGLSGLSAYEVGVGASLSGGGEPLRVVSAKVSSDLFSTLGARPLLGRTLVSGEDEPGKDGVVVLSEGLWRQRFGGDPAVIGRTVRLDGQVRTVVGVMPADFRFPSAGTQLWTPIRIDPSQVGDYWGIVAYKLVGRLAPYATAAGVQREVVDVAKQLRLENPLWTPEEGPYLANLNVLPLRGMMVSGIRPLLLMLLGAVALVLLVACANVANMLLARGVAREREIAVRAALGAGRGRLVRQLLIESLLLAGLGAGLGLALAFGGTWLLRRLLPADTPRLAEVGIDLRVLAFTLLIAVATGLIFGLLPALRASRVRLQGVLRRDLRSGGGGQRFGSSVMVAAEVAFSVVLILGAGLLLVSFWRLQQVDPGFQVERVVAAQLSPPETEFKETAHRRIFYNEVLRRVGNLPGVHETALTSQLPFDGETEMTALFLKGVTKDVNSLPTFSRRRVTPGFFSSLGIPLLRGRAFNASDRADAPRVTIIDETAARRFWPGQDPVGQVVGFPWVDTWMTVVGVVKAVRNNDLAGAPEPTYYVPFAQDPSTVAELVLRTSLPAAAVGREMRRIVDKVDAGVPVSDVRSMESSISTSLQGPRLTTLLLSGFAALALLLAAIGLYGVLAYMVRQRTHEIGVRLALGAGMVGVLRLVMRQGLVLAGVGVVLGLGASLLATRALASFLYDTRALDPLVYLAVPALLLVVAALASLLPARRAARVDPMEALRAE